MKRMDHRVALVTVVAGILLFVLAGCGGGEETVRHEAPAQERAFAMLDNYGIWVDIPEFGTVWRPRATADWRPYAYGHWEWSDEGWIWIGYEPFSWVVYHYGTWFDDREYGWVWLPSYDWSPARVSWLSSDEYTCWAPLPPPGRLIPEPGDPYWAQTWVVVPNSQFTQENVVHHNVPSSQNAGRVRGGAHTPPDVRRVGRSSDTPDKGIIIERDHILSNGRDLLRLRLPVAEERKIQSHNSEIEPLIMRGSPGNGVQQGGVRQPELRQDSPPTQNGVVKQADGNQTPAGTPDKSRPANSDVRPQEQPVPATPPEKKSAAPEDVKPAPKVEGVRHSQTSKPPKSKKAEKTRTQKPADTKKPVD